MLQPPHDHAHQHLDLSDNEVYRPIYLYPFTDTNVQVGMATLA